jgi:flagellar biosynthesis/type III secretory pathway M-ring protein FliF/YscJ
VVTVGTVNPGLTLTLVILFLVLVVTIVVMAFLLSRARTQMYAATREAGRSGGRHKAAMARAEEAEEQAARLFHAVETAVATARQAVNNSNQLELVNQQLGQLLRTSPSRRASTPVPGRPTSAPWSTGDP